MKNRTASIVGVLTAILVAGYQLLPKTQHLPKPECVNENIVFLQNDWDSYIYKKEVMSVLENAEPEDYRYFFQSIIKRNGKDYLLVNFRNQKECFSASMCVKDWGHLEPVRASHGTYYSNELMNLEWKIVRRGCRGQHKVLVFEKMDQIP